MKLKIIVLVGMIGSGKSTYCKNEAKKGFIIINDDSIVNMLHGEDYTLYDKSLKILYKSVENTIISTSLALNRSVIIDRGLNINLQGRKRYIALAKSYDVECECIVFKNEAIETHAKRRFESDNRGHDYNYWLRVANAHKEKYCEPSLEEGFDSVSFLDSNN